MMYRWFGLVSADLDVFPRSLGCCFLFLDTVEMPWLMVLRMRQSFLGRSWTLWLAHRGPPRKFCVRLPQHRLRMRQSRKQKVESSAKISAARNSTWSIRRGEAESTSVCPRFLARREPPLLGTKLSRRMRMAPRWSARRACQHVQCFSASMPATLRHRKNSKNPSTP